ncbi:hypothetical protein KC324_g21912, partial [Hortaea werneckii]
AEADEALEAVRQVGDYILAMSLELERRGMLGTTTADLSALSSDEDKKRVLELSAYFTVPARLEPQHRTLALFSAMNFAQKSKQWSSALGFANRVIEEGTNAKFRENAKRIKTTAERAGPTDPIEIDFDPFTEFTVCAASYTPIYA